jgi:hypothetical protein
MGGVPQSIDGWIRFAIEHRRLIEVRYGGAVRLAEPHDYGAINQVDRLLVFQLRGRPGSQGKEPWRILDLPKIESLVVLEQTFPGSRGSSHQSHREWDAVYARVA